MRTLIAIVGGFAGGVFARSLTIGNEAAIFFVLAAGIFAAFRYFKPHFFYTLAVAACLCASLGAVRMALSESPLPQTFASDLGTRVQYEGIVTADPDVRDKNQRVQLRVMQNGEATEMLAVAPRYPEVAVGEHVRVSGTLALPEAFADDGGRTFRYDKYLEREGVRFMLDFASLRTEASAPWYSAPAALAKIKHAFLDGIQQTLPEPHATLAGGIVIGGKSGLGTELKDDFVRSGLVQIIVLSGYNVMVVAELIMATLALTTLPRRWAVAAGALALLLFVGIAGFSATALRAALMALIALFARATGRTSAAGRALLFAILLMLVWNPLYLLYDPGFGLSVAATAGLIWLAPRVELLLSALEARLWKASVGRNIFESVPSAAERNALKNVSSERALSLWKNAIATTLAAQIAVLPLLLYFTGNLSFVSVPANLLVIPAVPFAMAFSALAALAGMLFGAAIPLLGMVIAFPAYLINAYILSVAEVSAHLPLAAITLPPFPFWLVLLAYAALIFIASSKRFSTTPQLRFAKKASI